MLSLELSKMILTVLKGWWRMLKNLPEWSRIFQNVLYCFRNDRIFVNQLKYSKRLNILEETRIFCICLIMIWNVRVVYNIPGLSFQTIREHSISFHGNLGWPEKYQNAPGNIWNAWKWYNMLHIWHNDLELFKTPKNVTISYVSIT